MDDPMIVDVLRSCAKDKPVISAEMLMMPGYTLNLPRTVDANDVKRFVFTGVAGNLKGFLFWQYRPEILGRETPTWGLTHLDGSETPRLRAFFEVGEVLQRNASLVLDGEPPRAEVALLYCPENQIFAWASTGSEKTATDALLFTHRALYEHNYRVDFIHPWEFDRDILDNYRVLIIPFPYCLPATVCRKLEAWVKAGGVLIGESYFGAWNLEKGHHEKTIPGHGLHRVFQARQDRVEPAGENGDVIIQLDQDLPGIKKGELVRGTLVKETFSLEGAEVLAHFDTGEPAVTTAQYGRGKTVLIGTYIGMPFQREGYASNSDLIAALVAFTADLQRPKVAHELPVRVDLVTDPASGMMLILQNLSSEPVGADITLPVSDVPRFREQFTEEELRIRRDDKEGTPVLQVRLAGREVKVYCG
jgi:beta-galactosidase